MPRLLPKPAFTLGLALLVPVMVTAQGELQPTGPDFQVNTYTPGDQGSPLVSHHGDGFVVVWTSAGSAGTDNSSFSVQGRRFASDGTALGSDFQVNTITTSLQSASGLASWPDGRFVVTWASLAVPPISTQAQLFNSNGTPMGAEITVKQPSITADVAVLPNESFVVVWHGTGSPGTDTDGTSVQAQRFASDGSTLGSSFQVNSYTTDDQTRPAVAALADSEFVVVWSSGSVASSSYTLQLQRFASDGSPLAGEFQVNAIAAGNYNPGVDAGPGGEFVVSWTSDTSPGTDTDLLSVVARRFDSAGAAAGAEFQVNLLETGDQAEPSVAFAPDGTFVVTFSTEANPNDSGFGIAARRFKADGTALGGEFQVNSYTTLSQMSPAVAAGTAGRFVIAWESDGSLGGDSGSGIQARLFEEAGLIFADGFESGTTSAWSAAVP